MLFGRLAFGELTKCEAVYDELRLDDADDEQLLAAIVQHPILLERPIVVRGDRAVIARPPERVLELLT